MMTYGGNKDEYSKVVFFWKLLILYSKYGNDRQLVTYLGQYISTWEV